MNRDDVIRMARVAGCHDNGEEFRFVELRYLERFASLVATAVREECAKLFDDRDKGFGFYEPNEPAQIIRARGEHMTPTQEAAMRLALEALEYYQHRRIEWDYSDEAVITALRAELAQDALDRMAANARELGLDYDPVQEPDLSLCPNCGGPADNGHDRSIPPSPYWCTKCMAEPVKSAEANIGCLGMPVNTPVTPPQRPAQLVAWTGCNECDCSFSCFNGEARCLRLPPRKPLTEEEIKACEKQAMVNGALPFEQRVFFARAIERAHGIN